MRVILYAGHTVRGSHCTGFLLYVDKTVNESYCMRVTLYACHNVRGTYSTWVKVYARHSVRGFGPRPFDGDRNNSPNSHHRLVIDQSVSKLILPPCVVLSGISQLV